MDLSQNISKNLIIIPGSCSSRTIWYDQMFYFDNLGFKTKYINLPSEEDTIHEASSMLFARLWQYRCELEGIKMPSPKKINENVTIKKKVESAKHYLNEDRERKLCIGEIEHRNIFISHSMGGMQLLYILANKSYFSVVDEETFNFIAKSHIIFSQTPLKYNLITLRVLRMISEICFVPMSFHNEKTYSHLDNLLFDLKKESLDKKTRNPILKFFDFLGVFNHLSILNAFLGTAPEDFKHLIDYYENWNLFTDDENNIISVLKEILPEDILSNYSFTTGYPDAFCSYNKTLKLASAINAKVKDFPLSFHLPMHMPWTQKAFNKWVGNIIDI